MRRSKLDYIEFCSTELLRRQAGRALTLQQLHALLRQELGPDAGTYHQLHQRLKKTSAPLRVLERAHPFIGEIAWPEDARVRYERALLAAGYDASPIVALTAADDASDVLDELRNTLLGLSDGFRQDTRFNVDIITALSALPELEQRAARAAPPTIPPHDLPPGA